MARNPTTLGTAEAKAKKDILLCMHLFFFAPN